MRTKREKNVFNKKKIWPTWQSAGTESLFPFFPSEND